MLNEPPSSCSRRLRGFVRLRPDTRANRRRATVTHSADGRLCGTGTTDNLNNANVVWRHIDT